MLQNSYLFSNKHTLFIQFKRQVKGSDPCILPERVFKVTLLSPLYLKLLQAIALFWDMRPPSSPVASCPHSFGLRNRQMKPRPWWLSGLRQDTWSLEFIYLCSSKLPSKSAGICASHDTEEGHCSVGGGWRAMLPPSSLLTHGKAFPVGSSGNLWMRGWVSVGNYLSCVILVNRDTVWQGT